MERETFENQAIWPTIDRLDDLIEKASSLVSAADAKYLAHARSVYAALSSHRDATDTDPYASTTMETTRAPLEQAVQHLTQFVSSPNVSYLQAMSSILDQVQHQYGMWPSAALRGGAAVQAHQAFREYKDQAEAAIENLLERNSELEQLLEERSQEAQQELDSLRQTITQLQTKITADEARLDTSLTANNEAFTAAQQQRAASYDTWIAGQGEEFEAMAHPHVERTSAIELEAQVKLEAITKLHTDVEKVSGKATAAILARGYGSYATREWASGVIGYGIGLVILVLAGIYLVSSLNELSVDSSPSWQFVAMKLGLTVTAAITAGFAFQFGTHAISRANTNKRVQLELATIGTFLADVDDEDRVKQAKLDFVSRMFGRAWEVDGRPEKGRRGIRAGDVSKLIDFATRTGK